MASDHTAHDGDGARFCERCGAALVTRRVEDRDRPVCPACEFVVYLDPKVAAGVIVTLDDEVVLLKRGIEPGMGKWVFPGGYVDRGEQVQAAAAREAMEEVGLVVRIEDLLGIYSYPWRHYGTGCVHGRRGRRQTGGELRNAGGSDVPSRPDSLVRAGISKYGRGASRMGGAI